MFFFTLVNIIIGALFLLLYAYQIFFIFYTLFKKPKAYAHTDQTNRYAVLICGRNETDVIGNLIRSIQNQDYPGELVDVFVCADNCTDDTAEAARACGAEVYERFNKTDIGKGYALTELIRYIFQKYGEDRYDGYFIIDADNLLDPHFVTEMDKALCAPEHYQVITGYRNSKNFGENWLSSGYAMWFLHDARQLNNARNLLGKNATVAGTGFVIRKELLKAQGGWIHHGLIEDIEFTADLFTQNVKFGYCHDAILYDEQPTGFVQSWHQRMRWVKGYLQVLRKYGAALIKGIFRKGGFSCFDLLANISTAYLLSTAAVVFNTVGLVLTLILHPHRFPAAILSAALMIAGGYFLLFFVGLFVAITERKRIHATTPQCIMGILSFPLFVITFIPIAIVAIFRRRVGWKPIKHTAVMSVEEVEHSGKKTEKEKDLTKR